ncbi:MAG: parallel beta-helix domain-containing protein [Polaribacter sp.]
MNTYFIKPFKIIGLFFAFLCFISCSNDDDPEPTNIITISPSDSAAAEAQLTFIEVESEKIIQFEEGVFSFTNTLSMDNKNTIIIRGAGRDKTFLDFSGQTSGGEGVLVTNSSSIRFENLTVRDATGDALKTRDCQRVSFVNVGTVWSGEPDENNGAYGLYPVLCSEVYIDNCYAYGASDAGIYVGQSNKVIVKNSVAEGNVAGIEIENTIDADVFDNEAFDNTGGILVFDLPGLSQSGNNTRVFNNNSHDNNRTNFAPQGNIVGNVPAGTGSMILSTKNVEVFNNKFTNNNFAGVLVSNYLLVNQNLTDPTFNPFPSGVHIHDNTLTMTDALNPMQPTFIQPLVGVINAYMLAQPHILIDGLIISPTDICIQEDASTTFINLNASDTTFSMVSTDITPHNCSPEPLPAVTFNEF